MDIFLARFKWYRRWRGGKWARTTGLFWGKKWVRVPDECVERVDEEWFTWSWNPLRRQAQMEEHILIAIAELGAGRSSLEIRQRLEAQGRIHLGWFYVALGELVEKGLIAYGERVGGPERNYYPWRAYRLTERGEDLVDRIFTQQLYAEEYAKQPCFACKGCLPPGEQCRACGRINNEEIYQ